jgi:mannose-6-phosphate isomerase class I
MSLQPLYVIPLIVEQPTWGGQYIADFKGITQAEVSSKRIGQSFELASDSLVTPSMTSAPAYGLATASDIAHPQWFNQPSEMMPIAQLIATDPEGVLGSLFLETYGRELKILIKFTQAQNNSYQVHVRPGQEFGQWLAKPESWYFLEAGQATLGLAPGVNVEEYRARVTAIDAFAQQLSHQVKASAIELTVARQQLAEMINQDHPRRFVNTVAIEPHQVVDMSAGGIHHSWEVGPDVPNGNIVYEVQVDVRDERCTLRSFDQGNIKDDGSVRPLTISDYFTALDTDPTRNQPTQYITSPLGSAATPDPAVTLFANPYYKTQLRSITADTPQTLQTEGTFHHLFAQSGELSVRTTHGRWSLPKGWSLFMPAGLQTYSLETQTTAQVLVTSI